MSRLNAPGRQPTESLVATALAAALVSLLLIAWALPQDASRDRPGVVIPAQQEPVELVDHMFAMKKSLKALAQGLAEGKPTDGLLTYVTAMQQSTMAAKTMDPTNLDELPEKQRDVHRRAFRADLALLLIELARVEIDLLGDRNQDAFARITGELFKLRETSHEKYQKP